jgi:hypothetical protein
MKPLREIDCAGDITSLYPTGTPLRKAEMLDVHFN